MKLNLLSTAILGILLFGFNNSSAQAHENLINTNICGTESPDQQWEQRFQHLIKEVAAEQTANKVQSVPYVIPVIIHVIHGGELPGNYPNLAQGQINSQVQVLNEDFGGIGYNSGNYPVNAFSNYAISELLDPGNVDGLGRVKIANCNIQFCLATKDSLGNVLPEPGIDRINYQTRGWSNPASFSSISTLKNFIDNTVKPQTIWNVSKYLNIWITDNNINANNLLGYATFPYLGGITGIPSGSTGSNTKDGYWCYSKAFGSKTIYPSGTYYPGYERGRTSTHEIGHWVGLRHIGGDGNNNPAGDCGATDYCDDTPPQKGGNNSGSFGQNFGSPAYPLFASGGASCPSAADGCMFMNFMDYTDDNSKYMYTTDQATRAQTAMTSSPYRKFLGTHNLCSVTEVASVSQFKVPATFCQLATVTLTNTTNGTPVPSYTWSSTGTANFLPDANSAGTVIFFTPGTYVITLTTDNGTVSVSSKTVIVKPSPGLILSSPSRDVCQDEPLDIVASGGTTYLWKPGNTTGPIMNYDGSADQTYTCIATSAGCTSTTEISLRPVDCTGITTLSKENSFKVFPNPSKDVINLKAGSVKDADISIQITDISGKIVLSENLNFKSNAEEVQLNISSLSKGLYILKLLTDKSESQFIKLIKE